MCWCAGTRNLCTHQCPIDTDARCMEKMTWSGYIYRLTFCISHSHVGVEGVIVCHIRMDEDDKQCLTLTWCSQQMLLWMNRSGEESIIIIWQKYSKSNNNWIHMPRKMWLSQMVRNANGSCQVISDDFCLSHRIAYGLETQNVSEKNCLFKCHRNNHRRTRKKKHATNATKLGSTTATKELLIAWLSNEGDCVIIPKMTIKQQQPTFVLWWWLTNWRRCSSNTMNQIQ